MLVVNDEFRKELIAIVFLVKGLHTCRTILVVFDTVQRSCDIHLFNRAGSP